MPWALAALVITIIVMAVLRLMWSNYLYQRQREMHHREAMAAIEKGLPIPPMPEVASSGPQFRMFAAEPNPRLYLLRGLIWLFVGLAIVGLFAGLSGTMIREEVPAWYYSEPPERRPARPPVYTYHEVPFGWAFLGLVPAGVGLAYLIFYSLEGRKMAAKP